jgi:MHS family proline/betaine transporter-like MFS transporter
MSINNLKIKNEDESIYNSPKSSPHKKLTKNQKQSIGLIQIGTFLEYFDLYLYIHMAVILNGIFFPKTDPYTASLLAAFTFSSTFLLRPIGALIFGYIGDNISRKASVVVTTLIMAGCSITIASTPSYEDIGIYASIILIVCRLLQGVSSVGEITGARIYIAEITEAPRSYFYTTLVNFFAEVGAFFALLVGTFFVLSNSDEGWRTAFYFGSAIAVIGSIARTSLRETPDFIREHAKKKSFNKLVDLLKLSKNNRKNFWYYIGLESMYPLTFYFSFIYLGDVLKNDYAFTPNDVISNNLLVAGVQLTSTFIFARLSIFYHPLKLVRIREICLVVCLCVLPFLYPYASQPSHIFIIQCLIGGILGGDSKPAHALFIKSFPIIGRYTQTALAFALSRTLMYVTTAYACVFIGKSFGTIGIIYGILGFALLALYCAFSFKPDTVESIE